MDLDSSTFGLSFAYRNGLRISDFLLMQQPLLFYGDIFSY